MMLKSRSRSTLSRTILFVISLIICGYLLSWCTQSSHTAPLRTGIELSEKSSSKTKDTLQLKPQQNKGLVTDQQTGLKKDYRLNGDREKATFVTLARNKDLWRLIDSMRHVEDRFNKKFKYDWVFLNDEEFSDEFKSVTTVLASGNTKYGLIPKEHWSFPEWIDQEKAAQTREDMKKNKVIYGDSISYRHMCRYESGFFWRHPLLDEYKYYWRVEPSIKMFCDVDYDLFKFMKDNNKSYAFTVSIPELPNTIPTLWETTKAFIKENPQYLAENNSMDFISNDGGITYNGCHFWSNFEIASLDFWKGEAYQKYFEYLDKAGGFFYERWGDAPVHSIAAALFLPRDKIHFVDDVGYFHAPFNNCPRNEKVRLENKCMCLKKDDFTWNSYSCVSNFYKLNNLERPSGWDEEI